MNTSIVVEKGVPLPVIRVNYPYETMEINDSFVVSGKSLQVVCNTNYRVGKKLGMRFVARKCEDGIRVWRVA
jgi:hypothetical protein